MSLSVAENRSSKAPSFVDKQQKGRLPRPCPQGDGKCRTERPTGVLIVEDFGQIETDDALLVVPSIERVVEEPTPIGQPDFEPRCDIVAMSFLAPAQELWHHVHEPFVLRIVEKLRNRPLDDAFFLYTQPPFIPWANQQLDQFRDEISIRRRVIDLRPLCASGLF